MLRKLVPLIAILAPVALAYGSTSIYTFNNLSTGPIAGQDNWMVLSGSGDNSDIVTVGTGTDATKVMANPNDGGSGTNVHRMGRTNNGNFSFGNLTGITNLTLSFDTQIHPTSSISSNNGTEFINFGLADNLDSGPSTSPAFAFTRTSTGSTTWAIGTSFNSTSGSFPSIPNNDWIRLTLVMDFTTNAGQGTANIFYQDLTAGGTETQLNVSPFGLSGVGSRASQWTTMWSRSDFSSNVELDNLTITVNPVPEMNGAWSASAAAILLAAHFVFRRRRVLV